jgi:hypothetical protein
MVEPERPIEWKEVAYICFRSDSRRWHLLLYHKNSKFMIRFLFLLKAQKFYTLHILSSFLTLQIFFSKKPRPCPLFISTNIVNALRTIYLQYIFHPFLIVLFSSVVRAYLLLNIIILLFSLSQIPTSPY